MKIHRYLVTSILKTFHLFSRSSADNKHRTRSHDLWRVTGNLSHATRNRLIEIEIETGLLYLICLISFIACRTCSPCIASISPSPLRSAGVKSAETKLAPVLQSTSFIDTYQVLAGCETSVFYFSCGRRCEQKKKKEGVWQGVKALLLSLFFPALLLTALHYPNAWNGLCQHRPRGVGLLKSHYGSWFARRHEQLSVPRGWVLRILSDKDDRFRDFWGVGTFWQVFFSLGSLIELGIFLGIQNNLKIRNSYII